MSDQGWQLNKGFDLEMNVMVRGGFLLGGIILAKERWDIEVHGPLELLSGMVTGS